MSRNRNLFGSLVGHLRKAKTTLDTQKDKVSICFNNRVKGSKRE